jgi:hypothetical protein
MAPYLNIFILLVIINITVSLTNNFKFKKMRKNRVWTAETEYVAFTPLYNRSIITRENIQKV